MKISIKKLFLLSLVVLAVASVGYILISTKNSNKTDRNTKTTATVDIIPGTTSQQEIINDLGKPLASSSGVMEYKSNSPTRNNEISLDGNTVSFYKEIVAYGDSTTFTELNLKYGDVKPLYGPDAVNGYYLYYYPENGVAYIANPVSSTVLEIWHFPKTTYQDFKLRWASDYSENFVGGQ